ncbi:cutinase family protein [Mycobacterium sp. UM_Kg27]|uniref:Cutinase family protein n=2 Tax=Mycobacteriaceae TaxID=1762 RepID=A0A9X7IPX8_9MYCO|nr:cutinase family protein [Mycobacterium sp. UM_Kg27]PQM53235.1 cutinase family protein [Mycolicibacter virginiensis]
MYITAMAATTARRITRYLATAMALGGAALLSPSAPPASAQPCPDVEVVFARGTGEPPGVGGIGQSFVDALHAKVGARSFEVYPVNYAASNDFGGGVDFARTVVDGIRDAGTHIENTAANCPNTRIVLGGFSQGAALAGYTTSAEIPKEVPADYLAYIPKPMPSSVADHVAAVVLFGTPSAEFLQPNGAPPVRIGPRYASKALELCADGDTICNGAPAGGPPFAHASYGVNGMTEQGAEYAAAHL